MGDCFIYNNAAWRLNYCVGGEVTTLHHLDKCVRCRKGALSWVGWMLGVWATRPPSQTGLVRALQEERVELGGAEFWRGLPGLLVQPASLLTWHAVPRTGIAAV